MCWRNELNDSYARGVIGDIKGFSAMIGFLGFGWMDLLKKNVSLLHSPSSITGITIYISCLSLPFVLRQAFLSLSLVVFILSCFQAVSLSSVVFFSDFLHFCFLFAFFTFFLFFTFLCLSSCFHLIFKQI